MDLQLMALVQRQFEDFVVERAYIAETTLKSNKEYSGAQTRRTNIFGELCQLSGEAQELTCELDCAIGEISAHETTAAYKQGFKDAMEIAKKGANMEYFWEIEHK